MTTTLNYHRRHTSTCTGKHPVRLYTNEYDERKKGWKKCHCPIYASGTLNRVAKRFPTKRSEWQEASDLMVPYLTANSWDLNQGPPRPPGAAGYRAVPEPGGDCERVPEPVRGDRSSIADAIQLYLDGLRQDRAAINTQRHYRYAMKNLQEYADGIGLRYVHEWTRTLVKQLRASWAVSPATAIKKLGIVKSFFEHCLDNEWITANPARIKVRRVAGGDASSEQRLPYTDEDLERMFDGCRAYDAAHCQLRDWPRKKEAQRIAAEPAVASRYREFRRLWAGEDLCDFICISVYTGLRISDVATFHIERLTDSNAVHVRTIKSQGRTKVYTRVPDWLAQRIRVRAKRVGPLIFGAHASTRIDVITDGWRKRLNDVWGLCGKWDVKPMPHRFRHTFARILLQDGKPVSVVAELMGNTEAVVRKHYKAFVKEHQDYLDGVMRGAFEHAPRPDQPRRVKVQEIRQA